MGKFADLEKKVADKKKKLEGLKAEAEKDPDIKKKYGLVLLALGKCLKEAGDGKKAEDVFEKASKDFESAYEAYKKEKNALKAALGKNKTPAAPDITASDLDAGDDNIAKAIP